MKLSITLYTSARIFLLLPVQCGTRWRRCESCNLKCKRQVLLLFWRTSLIFLCHVARSTALLSYWFFIVWNLHRFPHQAHLSLHRNWHKFRPGIKTIDICIAGTWSHCLSFGLQFSTASEGSPAVKSNNLVCYQHFLKHLRLFDFQKPFCALFAHQTSSCRISFPRYK